jgi:hypothetical protein
MSLAFWTRGPALQPFLWLLLPLPVLWLLLLLLLLLISDVCCCQDACSQTTQSNSCHAWRQEPGQHGARVPRSWVGVAQTH